MKKRFSLAMVFLLAVSVLVTACGGGGGATEEAPPANDAGTAAETPAKEEAKEEPAAPKPQELTMVHIQGESAWPAYEKLVKAFEEKTGHKVKLQYVPAGEFEKFIEAQFIAGSEPEIVYYNGGDRATWHKNNWIIDLYPYMNEANQYTGKPWKETYLPGTIESASDKTDPNKPKLYGIPAQIVTVNLYYNKKIFQEIGVTQPPATISEMIDVAKKAHDKGYIGFSLQNSLDWNLSWLASDLWMTLLRPRLAEFDVLNKNGEVEMNEWVLAVKKGLINENSPELKEYLKTLKTLSPYFNEGFNTASWEFEGLFNDGKSAMVLNGSWYPNQHLQGGYTVDYGIAAIPYLDKGFSPLGEDERKKYKIGAAPEISISGKAAKDGKLDAALQFLHFFSDPNQGAKLMTEELLTIPPVAGVPVPELLKPVMDSFGEETGFVANFNNFEPEQKDLWFKAQQQFLEGKMSEEQFLEAFGKNLQKYADNAIKANPDWKLEEHL
ncbi:ABC transporter substrate-binding protein [Paenibacillus sp.]|uniref:ABC transporter substrate-binding protein n=1 Tax=Paenibacillus sp. TaxID=58172 RepID=UPI002D2E5153|nr:extracellular solute-binding protein [Paenibacillus sp.]HZG57781.1 extracellular solute-binding protein [Paenibacillus sp.]